MNVATETEVWINGHLKPCTLMGEGICKYCHEAIRWATLESGRFIPLNVDAVEPGMMEPHFDSCADRSYNSGPVPTPPADGIQMTTAIWKQLLRFTHPDKHHGTSDERLANDLTAWLIDQRSRLQKK